jgi:protein-L-isoaspartate(D-aspartate) O-methyltransferase
VSTPARKIRLLMKLREQGITDARVLAAIETIPREAFLPDMFHDRAYEDMALPIGHGQTISQPLVVASMTQLLDISPKHKVLEIGTGSGYQASVLAKIARRVYTIERHKPLSIMAKQRLEALKLRNISMRAGDGLLGWPEVAPFERIIVTAGAAGLKPPQRLLEQMAIGGVMVLPMGEAKSSQHLYRIIRDENGYRQEQHSPVRFVPLLPGDPGEQPEPDDPLATLYRHVPKQEELL